MSGLGWTRQCREPALHAHGCLAIPGRQRRLPARPTRGACASRSAACAEVSPASNGGARLRGAARTSTDVWRRLHLGPQSGLHGAEDRGDDAALGSQPRRPATALQPLRRVIRRSSRRRSATTAHKLSRRRVRALQREARRRSLHPVGRVAWSHG